MSPSNVRRITGAGECVVNLKKGPMGKNSKIFLKYVLRLIVVLPLALVLTPPALAQATGVRFVCQLDNGAFTSCTSPATYSSVTQGTHTFAVKAMDAAGNQ